MGLRRTGPPARKAPLVARQGLTRGAPLARGAPLERGTPAPRKAPPRSAWAAWAKVTSEAWEAWGRRCAAGGEPLPREACHGHHRLMRSQGGPDTVANCLPLCTEHHGAVHRGGDASYAAGLLVRSWLRPEDVPVTPFPLPRQVRR